MANTVADPRLNVPVKMLRHSGEPVPKDVRDQRRAHGDVLREAAAIAGYAKRHKELADELGITESQLSEWYAGTENAQTWRFEQHPILGPAYLLAQGRARAEARGEPLRITMQIDLPMRRAR